MLKTLSLSVLLILCATVSLQAQSPGLYLDKGVNCYAAGKVDSAVFYWKRVVFLADSQSTDLGRALINLGVVSDQEENVEAACGWYEKLLASKVNDLDPPIEDGDQYACYHYHAAMRLASAYAGLGNARKALTYTFIADTIYPYRTSSGNAWEYQAVTRARWKATFYEKLNLLDSAFYVLTQKIIDVQPGYHLPDMNYYHYEDYYSDISKDAKRLSTTLFGSTRNCRQQLTKAIEDAVIVKDGFYHTATFILRNMTYKIAVFKRDPKPKDFLEEIQRTAFYKSL